jgi:hypothetical protein
MSHITSISLDPESAQLAQRMKREGKNFSKFVRECLHLYYREASDAEHMGETEDWEGCDPFCIPTRRHYCRVCWPTGTPEIAALGKARAHVSVLEHLRENGPDALFKTERLIEGLWTMDDRGHYQIELEPAVLEWLRAQAENSNRFIMPLADLELEGNAKPVKAEKPRKGLLKRILSEIGR